MKNHTEIYRAGEVLPLLSSVNTTATKSLFLDSVSSVNVPESLKAVPNSSLPNSPKYFLYKTSEYEDVTARGSWPSLVASNKLNKTNRSSQNIQDATVDDSRSRPETKRRGSLVGLLPLMPSNTHNRHNTLACHTNTPRSPNTPKSEPNLQTRPKTQHRKAVNNLEVRNVFQARKVGEDPVISHHIRRPQIDLTDNDDKSPTTLSSPTQSPPIRSTHLLQHVNEEITSNFSNRGGSVNRLLTSVSRSRSVGSSPVTSPLRRLTSVPLSRSSPVRRSLSSDATKIDPPFFLGPRQKSRFARDTKVSNKLGNNSEGAQGSSNRTSGENNLEYQAQYALEINRLREDFQRLVDFSHNGSQTVTIAVLEMVYLPGSSKGIADQLVEMRERLIDQDNVTFETFLELHFRDKSRDEIAQMVKHADTHKLLKNPVWSAADDFDDDEIDGMWSIWDLDGNGELDKFEFGEALKSIGIVYEDDLERILNEVDLNGNGKISKVEFKKWWNCGNHKMLRLA